MLVSGFTVIRNAELMGYPVVESIKSILPLVDEFIIGVGQSDDATRAIISALDSPKIKIFDSVWDISLTTKGLILSQKTNEALVRCQGDWCFYLQADEVIHESDLSVIKAALEKYRNDDHVEGLLFKYLHFYGTYDVIATARNWYRNEVRIVKRKLKPESVGDAQGFRVNGHKPLVKPAGGATVYHYGWVKPPELMGQKNKLMFRWWHGNKYDDAFKGFAYKTSYGLRYFKGKHPAVMKELVAKQHWEFKLKQGIVDWDKRDFKNFASHLVEKITGRRFGEHKNYVLIKD
jgi:glycosyltransferase involved in cell wall biosynthesis